MSAPGVAEHMRDRSSISDRFASLSWPEVHASLWDQGFGRIGTILSRSECEELRSLYAKPELFRSRIDMARFRFGRGEYQYFAAPIPPLVAELRESLYGHLHAVANEWMTALSLRAEFPEDFGASSRGAMPEVKHAPRRFCCAIARAITTACTRICMATSSSRSR